MSVPVGHQPRFVKRVSRLTNIRSQEGGFSVQFLCWVLRGRSIQIFYLPRSLIQGERVGGGGGGGGGGGVAVLDWSTQINYIEPVTHRSSSALPLWRKCGELNIHTFSGF